MGSPRRKNRERTRVPNAKLKPDLTFLDSGLFVGSGLAIHVRNLEKNKEMGMLLS